MFLYYDRLNILKFTYIAELIESMNVGTIKHANPSPWIMRPNMHISKVLKTKIIFNFKNRPLINLHFIPEVIHTLISHQFNEAFLCVENGDMKK